EDIACCERTADPRDECGALLVVLGLACIGQPRRKPAQLFVAGGVKVVLTPVHQGGTYMSSVALQVANSNDALARARALGAPVVSRPVTADEVRLPGVFGPGGMQFFFVDDTAASWPTEFGADLDRLADNTNTIRLDHLN